MKGTHLGLPPPVSLYLQVGAPLSHTELRLEAVPEMGYSPENADAPSGEVCHPWGQGVWILGSRSRSMQMPPAARSVIPGVRVP